MRIRNFFLGSESDKKSLGSGGPKINGADRILIPAYRRFFLNLQNGKIITFYGDSIVHLLQDYGFASFFHRSGFDPRLFVKKFTIIFL